MSVSDIGKFQVQYRETEDENHLPGPRGHIFSSKKEDVFDLAHCKGAVTTSLQFAVCWIPMSFPGNLLYL